MYLDENFFEIFYATAECPRTEQIIPPRILIKKKNLEDINVNVLFCFYGRNM
jgi:hypothetical protein